MPLLTYSLAYSLSQHLLSPCCQQLSTSPWQNEHISCPSGLRVKGSLSSPSPHHIKEAIKMPPRHLEFTTLGQQTQSLYTKCSQAVVHSQRALQPCPTGSQSWFPSPQGWQACAMRFLCISLKLVSWRGFSGRITPCQSTPILKSSTCCTIVSGKEAGLHRK